MNKPVQIATVTTLKASVRDTLSFVNYHLNSGIDHMYLFFDDPEDKSIPLLQSYENLSLIKCDLKHWNDLGIDPKLGLQIKQRANATLALDHAQKAETDWIIHIDVDELLYGLSQISNYFSTVNKDIDVLRLPVLEASPQKLNYEEPFQDIKYFKFYGALPPKLKKFSARKTDASKQKKAAWIWNQKRRLAKLLGSASVKGSKFLYGHQNGKSAVRTSTQVETVGTHYPEPVDKNVLNIAVSQVFFVLHYDCMGFENWKQKWKRRLTGENYHDPKMHSRQRVELTSQIKEALKSEESIKNLYKDLYYLSRYEMTVLRTLGLVKKIQLPGDLFDK